MPITETETASLTPDARILTLTATVTPMVIHTPTPSDAPMPPPSDTPRPTDTVTTRATDTPSVPGTATPEAEITVAVSGYVVGGGDTTPQGLTDAPRKFVYNIQTDDGSFVTVAYTAYPPSPVGDREAKKIRLNFHAGTILVGDYLKARGTYDGNTNTLMVAEEGDYIETYPEKP